MKFKIFIEYIPEHYNGHGSITIRAKKSEESTVNMLKEILLGLELSGIK